MLRVRHGEHGVVCSHLVLPKTSAEVLGSSSSPTVIPDCLGKYTSVNLSTAVFGSATNIYSHEDEPGPAIQVHARVLLALPEVPVLMQRACCGERRFFFDLLPILTVAAHSHRCHREVRSDVSVSLLWNRIGPKFLAIVALTPSGPKMSLPFLVGQISSPASTVLLARPQSLGKVYVARPLLFLKTGSGWTAALCCQATAPRRACCSFEYDFEASHRSSSFQSAEATGPGILGVSSSALPLIILPCPHLTPPILHRSFTLQKQVDEFRHIAGPAIRGGRRSVKISHSAAMDEWTQDMLSREFHGAIDW